MKKKTNKTNYFFIFSLRCTASLVARNEKIWNDTFENKKTGITFLHGILIGAKLRGSQVVDKLVA